MANEPKRKAGRPGAHDLTGQGISDLPVYTAQTIASRHTGIPMHHFRSAKAAGCPAFVSQRVHLRTFLEWYFTRDTAGGADHRARKEKADADLAEIKVEEARKNLVQVAKVEEWAETIFTAIRQAVLASSLLEPEKDALLNEARRLCANAMGFEDAGSVDETVTPEDGATSEDDGGGVGEHLPISPEGIECETGEIPE